MLARSQLVLWSQLDWAMCREISAFCCCSNCWRLKFSLHAIDFRSSSISDRGDTSPGVVWLILLDRIFSFVLSIFDLEWSSKTSTKHSFSWLSKSAFSWAVKSTGSTVSSIISSSIEFSCWMEAWSSSWRFKADELFS